MPYKILFGRLAYLLETWKVIKAELVYCGHKVMASQALLLKIVPNNSGHAFPFRTIMRIYSGIKLLSIRACLVASSTTHLPMLTAKQRQLSQKKMSNGHTILLS